MAAFVKPLMLMTDPHDLPVAYGQRDSIKAIRMIQDSSRVVRQEDIALNRPYLCARSKQSPPWHLHFLHSCHPSKNRGE
jgi:hypothetical protein